MRAGEALLTQTYDPYGNLYARTGADVTGYGFTGEQEDSSGLLYLRARYYAPEMGRFLNMDPSRMEMNPYQYGLSNPVMFTDPNGDCPWCLGFLVALILALSQTGSTVPPDVYQPAIVEYVEDPTVQQWIANDPTAELLLGELACASSESASVEMLSSLGVTGTLETLAYVAPAATLALQPMTTQNVIQGPIEGSYEFDVIREAMQAASSDSSESDQPTNPRNDDDPVTVYRVQGGILNTNQWSPYRIFITAGNIRIPDKSTVLHLSLGEPTHAIYYLHTKRPGGEIVSFDIPSWLAEFILNEQIAQLNYNSNPNNQGRTAPMIVDPETPGLSIGVREPWITWLEEHYIPGSGRIFHDSQQIGH